MKNHSLAAHFELFVELFGDDFTYKTQPKESESTAVHILRSVHLRTFFGNSSPLQLRKKNAKVQRFCRYIIEPIGCNRTMKLR